MPPPSLSSSSQYQLPPPVLPGTLPDTSTWYAASPPGGADGAAVAGRAVAKPATTALAATRTPRAIRRFVVVLLKVVLNVVTAPPRLGWPGAGATRKGQRRARC